MEPFEHRSAHTDEVIRRHGGTSIKTLRIFYGPDFAPGCRNDEKLAEVVQRLDARTLSDVCHDLESGRLRQTIVARSSVDLLAAQYGSKID